MRKKSTLTAILLGLVVVGAAGNLLVFYRYMQILNAAQRLQVQAQRLQVQAATINRNLNVVRAMAGEAIEFARKNPAMDTLLKSFTPLLQRLELLQPQPPR